MKIYDVAVIGGGLIGVSAAFELASRNLRVAVFDRQEPGREASWAAAGMLAPGPDASDAIPLVPLAKESLRLYPVFVAAIEESSGRQTGFVREGTIEIFFGTSGDAERDAFIAQHRQSGLPAEPISIEAAREMEPELGTSAVAAAWLADEATVDPRLLMEAALDGAESRGVDVHANCGVSGLVTERGRCTGVVARGEKITARHVVMAAGCYSGELSGGFARVVPTRPVRGQMISFRDPRVKLRRVLRSANAYVVPRLDGRIIAGSTLEQAGFDKTVTSEGMRKVMKAAIAIAPALAGAEVIERWAGLRPGTPDNLPILGPASIEGLIVATGHYRNGILLAAVTAKLVTAWIMGEPVTLETDAFSPQRFATGARA